jgi:tetratricopeptide (TPR) repeat protein
LASLAESHNEVRCAIEAGDLPWARERCKRILSVRPDSIETILLLAEIDLEAQKFRTASTGFQRVLQSDPEAYLAYAGLGIAYDQLGNPSGAVRWYTRALDLNPANAAIREERDRLFAVAYPGRTTPTGLTRFALGRQLFQSGFQEEGIARLRSALERHPEQPEIRLVLAEALWSVGQSAAAKALCQEIVRAEPRTVKANALLACIAAKSGDYARSQQLVDDVHAQDPEGHIAGYILAQSSITGFASPEVDLPFPVQDPEPPREPGTRSSPTPQEPGLSSNPAQDPGLSSSPTYWVRWMREALWTALRLIKPTPDEIEIARIARARIAPRLADAGAEQMAAPSPMAVATSRQHDADDHTEIINPKAARKRRRPSNDT